MAPKITKGKTMPQKQKLPETETETPIKKGTSAKRNKSDFYIIKLVTDKNKRNKVNSALASAIMNAAPPKIYRFIVP